LELYGADHPEVATDLQIRNQLAAIRTMRQGPPRPPSRHRR
jgi:hypothetical protein